MIRELSGEILVTGRGELTLEQPLEKSRKLLTRTEEVVEVHFKHGEPECPPCVPHHHNELDWEIVTKHVREDREPHEHRDEFVRVSESELFLKIFWHVSCPRTVVWRLKIET